VIAPSFTYVASHHAITATGAEVVFCDVEEPILTLNPDGVRELIGERTKAIMVSHFGGLVGRLDEIYRIAADHGLRVIEDAAHAIGTRHNGQLVGGHRRPGAARPAGRVRPHPGSSTAVATTSA
jgi:dTDP-4-amino-4,6-dideoxygalactose transaminase